MSDVLQKLKINFENRERTGFYASDFGKPALDLYFSWTNEPKTNPPAWWETLKWGAGNGVEDQMGKILKDSKIVAEDYDQKEHGRVEINIFDIEIHGYVDFITLNGHPIECKSINNKNYYNIRNYENGEPRENYVGQLAQYMYSLDVDRGALFVASIDGLNYFWIECERLDEFVFKCGNVTVDLEEEWKRWSKIYHENILKEEMPDIWEYRYKYDIEDIDWKEVSNNKISKARNNRGVIGDWQILYSDWKDKIIEMQGTVPGYTQAELKRIKELTDGYTTWD